MVTKADLHALVDTLPDDLADEAARRLTELHDPLVRALLTAPEDTPEDDEVAAIAAAEEELRYGKVVSDAELVRELGL